MIRQVSHWVMVNYQENVMVSHRVMGRVSYQASVTVSHWFRIALCEFMISVKFHICLCL